MKSEEPLYVKVYTILRQRIKDGLYPPKALLPSEAMLEQEFKVSQITVRRALHELQTDGYIRKMQGIGAVVLPEKKQDNIFELSGFSEEVHRQGKVPRSIILGLFQVEASIDLAEKLGIEPGESVTFLRRLRLVSDEIIGINETYISPRMNLNVEVESFQKQESLYAFYSQNGIFPTTGVETFEVVMPDKKLKAELSLEHPEPLLLRQRTTFDPQKLAIEYSRNYYIARSYKFTIDLKRDLSFDKE
ncbi:MAG: GntR family transcriptional regulator [Anaerolineaceae bacterium]|nr:GntR family transcriptional regulator [Anaerolineaceae bacterium]